MNISLPLICVDCSDFKRTGDYISEKYKTRPYICIDHHTSNARFAENNIVNTSAAATAEIVADLMLQNGIRFNQKISNLLYLGIMTDTNRFTYETTTKNTLRIVEHLVDNGANLSSTYYDVYEHDSIERYIALEIFLKNICVFANGKCCISHLTFDDLEKVGAKHSDTEGFVNYARQLDGVDIGAFLEFNKDYINCSMRAKSPKFRIDIFAEKFGGGGYPAASGFDLKNFQKNFYQTFKLELANYVKAFTKIMTVNDDDLNGVLLVNKPKGLTSHDVIDSIRKKFRIKKVGHAGTLDPMAIGLLIVLIGKATKISQHAIELSKTYEGTMRLGEITDSHDAEGTVIERRPVNNINPDAVAELSKKFLGDQYQIPPMFSAKKVNGQKLYKLARKGQIVDRKPQAIHIFSFDIIDIRSAEIDFSVTCSKGTYVRTLANDFGEKLGCGAYLIRLCRTKIGDLSVENSLIMDEILNMEVEDLKKHILCPEEILL